MSIEPPLTIDVLRSLSSRIRGSDRLTTGRRILVLAALALLAKECRLGSLWNEIRNSAVHYGDSAQIEMLLFKVARLVEDDFGALDGIFTHHLVRDILLVGGSLPEHVSSAAELTQFPELETIEKFGELFDSALDDLSFGPSISETATPRPLARLMVDLAKCFEGAKVADFSCGQGALLAETAHRKLDCYLVGQELNSVAASLATLRLFLLGSKAKIVISDALLAPLLTSQSELLKFDIVLCDPPIGPIYRARLPDQVQFSGSSHRHTRLETQFLEKSIASLNANGRACVLVPQSFLSRRNDKYLREQMVIDGILEGVISLPKGIVPWTEMNFVLLVISCIKSNRSNHTVSFLDATKFYTLGRRRSDRIEDDIAEKIFFEYVSGTDSTRVARIGMSVVRESGFKLLPSDWVSRASSDEIDVKAIYNLAHEAENEAVNLLDEIDNLLADIGMLS